MSWYEEYNVAEEYRDSSFVTESKDLNSFIKQASDAHSQVGKLSNEVAELKKSQGVAVPGEGASEEDINNFYKNIGWSENIEDYKAEKPELPAEIPYSDSLDEIMTKSFHNRKLTPDQAKGVREDYHKSLPDIVTNLQQQQYNLHEEKLKQEFGEGHEEAVGKGLKVLMANLDENEHQALTQELDATKNSYSSKLMKALGKIHEKHYASHDPVENHGRTTGASQNSISEFRAKYNDVLGNPAHREYEQRNAELLQLYRKKNGEA